MARNTAFMLAGEVGVKRIAPLFPIALIAFGSVIYGSGVLRLQGIGRDERRFSFAPVSDAFRRVAWRP
jgi:hypothetical protein